MFWNPTLTSYLYYSVCNKYTNLCHPTSASLYLKFGYKHYSLCLFASETKRSSSFLEDFHIILNISSLFLIFKSVFWRETPTCCNPCLVNVSKLSRRYCFIRDHRIVRLKRLPPMRETRVWSLGQEDPLEKEMVTCSSILAWRIPWMEKLCRLQSTGSQRVGHDWVTSPHLTSIVFKTKPLS